MRIINSLGKLQNLSEISWLVYMSFLVGVNQLISDKIYSLPVHQLLKPTSNPI